MRVNKKPPVPAAGSYTEVAKESCLPPGKVCLMRKSRSGVQPASGVCDYRWSRWSTKCTSLPPTSTSVPMKRGMYSPGASKDARPKRTRKGRIGFHQPFRLRKPRGCSPGAFCLSRQKVVSFGAGTVTWTSVGPESIIGSLALAFRSDLDLH